MQLPKGSHNIILALAAVYIVYKYSQGYKRLDKVVNEATKPVGQLWSDVDARLGGWSPVELTDLVIQPWYLNTNFVISEEAWQVLTRDTDYRVMMKQLFDGRTLKPEYRHLIGKPIGGL
ncbi:hypothetical protein Ssed_2203 [Shewanella sediminis HAW-EB3]|uniref:Uncharacterized protein n=2 Tax=Shewanella sediminis TaxID=271097 RepID=A8FVD9_SHESH|nr:hypothetical protein Ssed_2203 [Shewanella sediminis HAW-EB3]